VAEQLLTWAWGGSNIILFTHAARSVSDAFVYKQKFENDDYRPLWETSNVVRCLLSVEVLVPGSGELLPNTTNAVDIGAYFLRQWQNHNLWNNGVTYSDSAPMCIHNIVLMWCLDIRYRVLGIRDWFYKQLQALISIKTRYVEDVEQVLLSLQQKAKKQTHTRSQPIVDTYTQQHKNVARSIRRFNSPAKKHETERLIQMLQQLVEERQHVSWIGDLQKAEEDVEKVVEE
jgi:hypothetical protein